MREFSTFTLMYGDRRIFNVEGMDNLFNIFSVVANVSVVVFGAFITAAIIMSVIGLLTRSKRIGSKS